MKKRIRIVRSEKLLSELLIQGEKFRIGVPFEQADQADFLKYGMSGTFVDGTVQRPRAAGPRSKANLKGLYVRADPHQKEEKLRHINYTRKDGIRVEFDRIYKMYKLVLLDVLKVDFFHMVDEDGVEFIASDVLVFDNRLVSNKVNTHIINLFLEVFGSFEVLREDLTYVIAAQEPLEQEVLPSGERLVDSNFNAFVEYAQRTVAERDRGPLIERVNVLKEFSPIVRKAPGKNGYIVFVFPEKGIVAAESVKQNNATYFFKMQGYEDQLMKDKQQVLNNRLMYRRFYHSRNKRWERKIRAFLNKH
jgi:hypothetical protein